MKTENETPEHGPSVAPDKDAPAAPDKDAPVTPKSDERDPEADDNPIELDVKTGDTEIGSAPAVSFFLGIFVVLAVMFVVRGCRGPGAHVHEFSRWEPVEILDETTKSHVQFRTCSSCGLSERNVLGGDDTL